MKKAPPPPKPKAVPGLGRPLSEEDDFGEKTFARALKTVKETLNQATTTAEKPKRIRRSKPT